MQQDFEIIGKEGKVNICYFTKIITPCNFYGINRRENLPILEGKQLGSKTLI